MSEALEKIESAVADDPFAFVFLDWEMPDMNGSQVASKILDNGAITSKPKLIMITAYGREEIMKEAEEAGVDGFLIKPVSKSLLFDTIMEIYYDRENGRSRGEFSEEGAAPVRALEGVSVLLVEDNEINQQVAGELLEHQGVRVAIADNGREAVDYLRDEGDVDLVLMDLQMPVMDGYEATRVIREDLKMKDLPVLAMTADAMEGILERTREAGMNDCITKPLDIEALYEKLLFWSQKQEVAVDIVEEQEGGENVDDEFMKLDGIDWQAGLKRVANNSNLYRKLLVKFFDKNREIPAEVRRLLKENRREDAERVAHTLKGVSGNIGAMNLHEKSVLLDRELKNENPDTEKAEEYLQQVERCLETVLASIEKNIISPGHEAEDADVPGNESGEELFSLVKDLRECLESFSTRSEDVFNRLLRYMPEKENEGMIKLEDFIRNYRYDEALAELDTIMQK